MSNSSPNTCLETGLSIPECSCVSCTRRLMDLPAPAGEPAPAGSPSA